MAALGRPTDYSPELAADICERLVEGESLRAICRSDLKPSISTVMLWLTKHTDFSEQYRIATDQRSASMFEDMLDLADNVDEDSAAVAKARLQVDTRKWALSRMNPKKYGDKVAHVGDSNDDPIQTALTVTFVKGE